MNKMMTMLIALTVVAGCVESTNQEISEEAAFLAPGFGEAAPWTHDLFDSADDKFTFAVHSDLTGGERERIYEVAIAQLSLLRPEFIINVGDLIEGDTDKTVVDRQWDSFDERANRAKAPVFYVPGNHDRTGELMQAIWDRRQGRGYYHFRYKDVLFLVLDTEDNTTERIREIEALRNEALAILAEKGREAMGETEYFRMPEGRGGNISAAQSNYMTDAIKQNDDVRWTFMFMHKAPWMREDMTTFTDIEDALASRPYTLFHGHLHAYEYQQRKGNDYIRLATTGGGQFPQNGRSMDHVTMVTVDNSDVDIANVLLEGILDKTGQIPLNGDELCFEAARCPESE